MMEFFQIDPAATQAVRARAARQATTLAMGELLARLGAGHSLADEELAAVFLSPHISTGELLASAQACRPDGPHLETFSPLYITNECDAECRMCGMRRTNDDLVRASADRETVEGQLGVLLHRGMRGVAILAGEYRQGARRQAMIARSADAVGAALERGFMHVLVNIGALDTPEYETLLGRVGRRADGHVEPRVTMCTFQETYDPTVYARFMGDEPENPRADFARRLINFDRARAAGMWCANPGVLLGLNHDLGYELLALLAHVAHLEQHGMCVYISVPRLRRASGTPYPAGVSDDALCRFVAVLALGRPTAKVVISTRESPAIQQRLAPVIGVLTPGSPGVAPYTLTGARFELEASQFEVLDHRPFEEILGDLLAAGATIDCFDARRPSAA